MDSTTFAAVGKANKLRMRLFKVSSGSEIRIGFMLDLAMSILWTDNPESTGKVFG
jgi:hypothetical protein